MKKILITIASLVGLIALSACSNTQNGWIKTVKIWVIAPISGPAANLWQDFLDVFIQSVDEFNSANKSLKVDLVIEDWKCSWKDGASAIQKLINVDKVNVILWWLCSSETMSAGKIAQQMKMTLLTAWSSAPDISNIWDYIFRFRNDTSSAIKLWWYVSKTLNNIALITEDTDYAQALSSKFKESYKWNIVIDEKYATDEKDFDILSKKIMNKKSELDWVVFIPQSDTSTISAIKSFDKNWALAYFSGKIVTAMAFSMDSVLKWVWDLTNWLIESNLGWMDIMWSKWNDFMTTYKQTHTVRTFDWFVLLWKEGIDLILDAIKAWNYDSESFKTYFQSIDKSHPRDGYRGEYYFDGTDAIGLKFVIQKIVNGKPVFME